MNLERLFRTLIRHEGMRLKPYKCTMGKLTIGVGRNLEDNGITEKEALMLLHNDIEHLLHDQRLQEIIQPHDNARQEALVNMAFNMGVPRLLKFKNMLRALEKQDYIQAALDALDSRWAEQVGNRAQEIAMKIKDGKEGEG